MDFKFLPFVESHKEGIRQTFDYYAQNGFAAFLERTPESFVEKMYALTENYPRFVVLTDNDEFAGFGALHPYHPFPAFKETSEIAYFIKPEFTGMGLGSKILKMLEKSAKERGLSVILACISDKNQGSIRFHEKNGFEKWGFFPKVGKKFDEGFGLVWMGKRLDQ
jgi:phosphinothricin acetyltransferase